MTRYFHENLMNGKHRNTYLTSWMQNSSSRWMRALLKRTTNVCGITRRLKTDFPKTGGGETVFCNPPYSGIKQWVKKAFYEGQKDGTTVVLLIPARTDTKWFHNYILNHSEIRFIEGRLRFNGMSVNAPFPSMIVIFRGAKEMKRKNRKRQE